jgi:ATP phosphoribosyltransferase regulatory subunit
MSSAANSTGLLPAGFADELPPESAHAASVVERLLACFARHGYRRVNPPLVEFEETLLAGAGQALAGQMFRLMDPVSQRMMGLRTDMTPQVARIAATRLRRAPRPLRLSYAGEVMRVRGSQVRPEREFGQVGVELIGSASRAADAEVLLLAAEGLTEIGVRDLSIDLTHPRLAQAVCAGLGLEGEAAVKARQALDHKDAAQVAALGGQAGKVLGGLLAATGPAQAALAALARLGLPAGATAMVEELKAVVRAAGEASPDLPLTLDPGEFRGLEYHSGVCFTFFARGVRVELGGGGRYGTTSGESGEGGEAATGFTLYMDSLMRAVPAAESPPCLYLPAGTPAAEARRWRAQGWVALQGLDEAADANADARRLGCTHSLRGGRAEPLKA